jgi:hypothetical protein
MTLVLAAIAAMTLDMAGKSIRGRIIYSRCSYTAISGFGNRPGAMFDLRTP